MVGRKFSLQGNHAHESFSDAFDVSPGPEQMILPSSGVATNGKPIFNWDQAAAQIDRQGAQWTSTVGGVVTVTYAFRATAPTKMPQDTAGFSRFNDAQIAATQEALALWSDVANINFVRVGSGSSGNGAYSNNATILFGNYSTGAASAAAFANYPGSTASTSVAGDVWVNVSLDYNANPVFLAYGQQVLEHEIGHALGLSHPGDYNAGDATDPTYDASAVFWQDTRMFTVMSYFGSVNTGGSLPGLSNGPQLFDIAAIQGLYGARTTTRTGDTIYGFNSNTGHAHYSIVSSTQGAVFSIWDGGGNDTLDLSGYSTNSDIDLRPESFTSAGPGDATSTITTDGRYNISIARGVTIENAIGGSGNDTITGNTADNHLSGSAGDDVLIGGMGADALDGGQGSDTASYIDAAAGLTVLLGAPASNTDIAAGDTYVSIENLTGSAFNDVLGGDSGANIINAGAGNDYIDGGAGADTMIGGLGNDSFVVDNVGDVVIEAAGEGADTVFAYASFTLSANLENLVLLGAAVTGFGNESNNAIAGDALDNTLAGFGGSDNIDGGAGNDYIDGGAGADFMHGGLGNDSFVVESAGDIVDEAAGQGADTVFAYISFTLGANLENLFLLGSAIIGYGNSAGNVIYGDDQNNTLGGFGGNDTIDGGAGNDYIDGGAGIDFMHGGLGNDTFVVDNASDTTDEASGEGTDTVFAYVNWTLAANTENLTLLGSATSATGNELNNVLVGNTLANTFTGGDGDDKFVFRAADLVDGVQDTITDFEAHGGAEDDKISFRGISASAITMHDVSGGVEIDIDLGGGHTASVLVQNQTTATIADDIFFGI